MPNDFITINVNIGGKTQTIQMQKGMSFENKGGQYCLFADGTLKFKPTGSSDWQRASQINMTNYQWQVFRNVANNDGNANTYSKQDVQKALELYKNGKFIADMSQDLPNGYKIEHPQRSTSEQYVQVAATNGNAKQSATLRFQITDANKTAKTQQTQQTQQTQNTTKPGKRETYGDLSSTNYNIFELYPNGKIKKWVQSYRTEGTYQDEETYEFDSTGRLIKCSSRYKQSRGDTWRRSVTDYKYDNEGNITLTYNNISNPEFNHEITLTKNTTGSHADERTYILNMQQKAQEELQLQRKHSK